MRCDNRPGWRCDPEPYDSYTCAGDLADCVGRLRREIEDRLGASE
jgi:hypothetical protein